MTSAFSELRANVEKRIIGQPKLVNRLLVALLADGHLIVEGPPGLAKTTAIHAVADGIEADFQRIQFTPDLLPADLIGCEVFRQQDASFEFQKGPIFHNLLLADEINRAPPKVQSALLEAMAERQVTVGGSTYKLPELFLVMATQNPIENEGTYRLPEAQLDRFLLHVRISYPDADTSLEILRLVRRQAGNKLEPERRARVSQEALFESRREVMDLFMEESLERYIVELVQGTHAPGSYGDDLPRWIEFGASPRAMLALERCGRAHAWLRGNDYVSPDDIQAVAPDVLRHRLILTMDAESEGKTTDSVIAELLARVPVG